MRRSTIILIVVVIVILLAAAGVYLLYLRATSSGNTPIISTNTGTGSLPSVGTQAPGNTGGTGGASNPSSPNGGLGSTNVPGFGFPGAATGNAASRFGLVTGEPVLAYFADPANNVTIVEPDGRIASVLNGQPTFLNSTPIQSVISAAFSYDGSKVLVGFGDPSNPQSSIFTLATKSWTPLPAGILSPAWSPTDARFAYLTAKADGGETISTLDTSKAVAKAVAVATLHQQDVTLSWPTKNGLVIADKPSAYETGAIMLFDMTKKVFSEPLPSAAGLDTVWSNDTSSQALVFTAAAAERGGSLSLWNPTVPPIQPLTFITLPSKCVFHDELASPTSTAAIPTSPTPSTTTSVAFYCGIPQDPSVLQGQVLPDLYDQGGLFTVDSIYSVRTDTGAISEVLVPPVAIDATNLRVFNNALFFVNRYDKKLYAVSLGA